MSKIYEALLRAELERAGKTGSNSNGAKTAEEMALANTLEPYVPEPQPQFRPHFDDLSRFEPPTEPLRPAPLPPYAAPVAETSASPIGAPPPVTVPFPGTAAPGKAAPETVAPELFPRASPAAAISEPAPSLTAAAFSPVQTGPARVIAAPVPAHASTATAFDPNQVRTLPWTPVLERLPSLAERGRSVEQFRSLRSRLAEFRDSSVPLKSLLVTSGLPQEGKSFVAANLAVSLSRHRANRVLLIDGDIRRSSQHAILGTSAEPGLTEYLSGKAELSEVLQRCQMEESEAAFHNGLSSLTFIAGGSEPDKAADLSGNPRFAELLETVGPHFDWIIIDSSPVNLVSDGVNFARACDGVLLVAREGVTKFEVAQNAQQQLKSTNLLGFVLNAVHTASTKTDDYNYGPYGSYGSYGGYGYSTTKR